jgi:zinc transport system substrate-binding protein
LQGRTTIVFPYNRLYLFTKGATVKTKLILRTLFVLICLITVIAAFNSCRPADKSAGDGHHKLRVITTIFPLYDMAKNVGAEKAAVSLLLPPGVEAHSFEPTPGDIVKINEADIFIYTGRFMEPWAEEIIRGAATKNLIVVDASRGTKMVPGVFHDKDEPAGSLDPHIWLDFDNAKIMLGNILQAFQTKDSAAKSFYERRAADYSIKLAELDSAYKSALTSCKKKKIVYAGHYAFGYLAKRYGLNYLSAQGVSPDAEPTAKDLGKLVEQIRRDKIKYIYYEELASPKIAETIASETGAKMLMLNAAHNLAKDQFEKGISFFDILRNNLDNLKIGLDCGQYE